MLKLYHMGDFFALFLKLLSFKKVLYFGLLLRCPLMVGYNGAYLLFTTKERHEE